ncbi:hypothetical protein, partial [Tenacibaculum finnmarkense]
TTPKIKTFIGKYSLCYWNSSKNQNIHWQILTLLLEQLQKSKHSLANTHFYSSSKSKHRLINTHFATGTAPKIKTFIGKYSLCYWNNSSKSKYSLANTHFATGTTPVNQNIHWQILTFTAPVNQNIHW